MGTNNPHQGGFNKGQGQQGKKPGEKTGWGGQTTHTEQRPKTDKERTTK